MMDRMKQLQEKIAYTFKDEALLKMAVSHRSVPEPNYERLEFLGDSVLDLVIAEALYKIYEQLPEGMLSRYRSKLVCKEALATHAKQLGIGEFLRLGCGEMKTGGANRDSILADALEAIMGAMYLDSDILTVKAWILNLFSDAISFVRDDTNGKDPKTSLQEYVQRRKKRLPIYEVISSTGDANEQSFVVSCTVAEYGICEMGEGNSRRKAEQEAAAKVLVQLPKIRGK